MHCDNYKCEKFGPGGNMKSSYTPRPSHHQQNFPSPRQQNFPSHRQQNFPSPIYTPPFYQTPIYGPPFYQTPTYTPPIYPTPYTPPPYPQQPSYPPPHHDDDLYTLKNIGIPSSICCIIFILFLATRILPGS